MKSKHHFWHRSTIGTLCVLLGGYALFAMLLHRNSPAQVVAASVGPEIMPGKDAGATRRESIQAQKRLRTLWKQRNKKNIAKDVLPFLKHPLPSVRLSAVKMLGRLENPVALDALKAINVKEPNKDDLMAEGEVAPSSLSFAVPLAIGRIKSKGLKGKRKIETVLIELGLNFEQLAAFTVQLSTDRGKWRKVGNRVVEEVLNVLYTQKKKGEDVSPLVKQLRLRSEQALLLQAAQQGSVEREAKFILDYVTRQGDDGWLIGYLMDLGPKAQKVALGYSDQILRERKKYPYPDRYLHYQDVLVALVLDGELGAKSLLTKWSHDRDPRISELAAYELYRLNAQAPR